MKKILWVVLVLALIVGGLFFWKGGHHAIVLAEKLEEWLDADDAAQTLTLQIQSPGFEVQEETGRLDPRVEQMTLTAESFWTEYADRTILGLTAQGISAYTDGRNLYMDTGKAYALPELTQLRKMGKDLGLGLLLHGRVRKSDDAYRIDMTTDALELHISVTADRQLRAVNATAITADETAVTISLTPKASEPHALPQPVLDAIVRATMEPPMAISEPLELLMAAFEKLLPLQGDLTLGVDCGILNISDTAVLRVDEQQAVLERRGATVTIPMEGFQPLPAALLLLRNGDFSISGNDATVVLTLPTETTGKLCTALVPQIESLGMTFGESSVTLSIAERTLNSASLRAEGEVPFLVTTIPLSFTAELNIQ